MAEDLNLLGTGVNTPEFRRQLADGKEYWSVLIASVTIELKIKKLLVMFLNLLSKTRLETKIFRFFCGFLSASLIELLIDLWIDLWID